MAVSSECIYYLGLALTGAALLAAAAAVPTFFLMGSRLKKRLEAEYGKSGRPRPPKRTVRKNRN